MTQKKRLLEYMREHDGITALEAQRDLGIMRLAARIFDLRDDGYLISTERVQVLNRFMEATYVTRYRVVE